MALTAPKKDAPRPARRAPPGTVWAPVAYEVADIGAVQGLLAGTASPEQQRRALRWVIEVACGTYDFHYQPGSERDTAFGLGRAFVGQQIVKLTKLNLSSIRRNENVSGNSDGQ